MPDKKYTIGSQSVTDKYGNTHDQFIFVRQKDGSRKKTENQLSGDLFEEKTLKQLLKSGVLVDPSKKSTTGGGGSDSQ